MHEYIIETDRLILRPLCDEDRDAIFQWVSDENVAKYMVYNTYTSKEQVSEWLSFLKSVEDDEGTFESIELVAPHIRYAEDIWNFRQEILNNDTDNEDQFAGCGCLDKCNSAEEWIRICKLRNSGETCNEGGTTVPSDMYLAIRKSDDKIIGIIDLRHHINQPILGTWGGHTGYSVRPSERRKGYAKEMLRLNIQNARALGIKKMLVTCGEANKASEQTILSNGGIFEKGIEVEGVIIKRYWIDLTKEGEER